MSGSVLDVEHLRPLFAGEEGELRALIEETITSSATLIDKLHEHRATRNADAAKTAHELKGLARTVGAEELGAISEQAEVAANGGHWIEFSNAVDRMHIAHGRLVAAALSLASS